MLVTNHTITITCTALLLLFLTFYDISAQTVVKGTVSDSEGLALPSATVLILHPADSVLVKGGVTDDSGTYRLKDIPQGSYILSVSMVGFTTYYSDPIEVGEGDHQMRPVELTESVEQLGEVSVTARKPLYEKEIDRLVVNVQRSVTSAGSNVLEVLSKSPGVQVNRQNNTISLNGKSDVQVMINDKIMRLPLESVLTMLDGMSAANIEEIELISKPPAKYEAEGDAGIINIKTKEHSDLGYTGTAGTSLGYNNGKTLGGNFSFSRRKQDFAYFVNYSIHYNENRWNWLYEGFLTQESFTQTVRSDNNRDPSTGVQNLTMGLDFDLSDKTNADLMLTGFRRRWVTEDISNNLDRPAPGTQLTTELHIEEENLWRNGIVNAGLEHAFREGSELSLDLDYLYYKNDNPSEYENIYLSGDASLLENEGFRVAKETPIRIWVSKIDYRNEGSSDFTVETGLKSTFSNFSNQVNVTEQATGGFVPNDRFSSLADLDEFIGAAYLSVDLKPLDNLQVKGGLRFEYVTRKLSSPENGVLVDRESGRLFPSLFLSQAIDKDNKLQFAYSRRTTRPGFWDLAPFVFFLNPKTVISGNSDLESAISDGVSLGYIRRQLTVTLAYTHSRDEIVRWQPSVDMNTNEQTLSTQNLEYLDTYSLTLGFPVDPTPWWNLQANVSGRYQIYRTSHLAVNPRDKGAGMNASVVNSFELPNDYSLELSGFYNSVSIWGISRYGALGSLDAGIQKKVWDGQGTFRLSVTDILDTNIWTMDNDIESRNFTSFSRSDYGGRSVRLSFTLNFGSNEFEKVEVESGSDEEQSRVGIN